MPVVCTIAYRRKLEWFNYVTLSLPLYLSLSLSLSLTHTHTLTLSLSLSLSLSLALALALSLQANLDAAQQSIVLPQNDGGVLPSFFFITLDTGPR